MSSVLSVCVIKSMPGWSILNVDTLIQSWPPFDLHQYLVLGSLEPRLPIKGCNVNSCSDFGLFCYKFYIKIYTSPFFSVSLLYKELDIFIIDNFFLRLIFHLGFINIFDIAFQ